MLAHAVTLFFAVYIVEKLLSGSSRVGMTN